MPYIFLSVVCLTLACIGLAPVYAQAPEPFERTGVIDLLVPGEERIVIYDVNYRLPASVPVYFFKPQANHANPEERQRASQQSLRVGMHVGYTIADSNGSTRHPRITELWILPQDGGRQKGKQEPLGTPRKR